MQVPFFSSINGFYSWTEIHSLRYYYVIIFAIHIIFKHEVLKKFETLICIRRISRVVRFLRWQEGIIVTKEPKSDNDVNNDNT